MRSSIRAAIVAATCAMIAAGIAGAQGSRLYKWVDEQGNVHYSDRVEASATGANPERISANGLRVGTPHSALPRNRDEVRQQEEARRLAQLDMMLLSSYGTELDLLRSHDQSREPIENGLRTAESNIARLRQELAARQSRANDAPGGASPADPEIERIRSQISSEEASLEVLRARRFELYERQNFEVARYRELTTRNG